MKLSLALVFLVTALPESGLAQVTYQFDGITTTYSQYGQPVPAGLPVSGTITVYENAPDGIPQTPNLFIGDWQIDQYSNGPTTAIQLDNLVLQAGSYSYAEAPGENNILSMTYGSTNGNSETLGLYAYEYDKCGGACEDGFAYESNLSFSNSLNGLPIPFSFNASSQDFGTFTVYANEGFGPENPLLSYGATFQITSLSPDISVPIPAVPELSPERVVSLGIAAMILRLALSRYHSRSFLDLGRLRIVSARSRSQE